MFIKFIFIKLMTQLTQKDTLIFLLLTSTMLYQLFSVPKFGFEDTEIASNFSMTDFEKNSRTCLKQAFSSNYSIIIPLSENADNLMSVNYN